LYIKSITITLGFIKEHFKCWSIFTLFFKSFFNITY